MEVLAYIDGEIVEIFDGEGVAVETRGAYIQGIFGVGGECWGPLHVAVGAPDQELRFAGARVRREDRRRRQLDYAGYH